jgi:hypothetical protein
LPSVKERLKPLSDKCREHPVFVILAFLCTVVSVPLTITITYCWLPWIPACRSGSNISAYHDSHVINTPTIHSYKSGIFVHSSINSKSGYQLSDALASRLESLGLSVASDRTDAGFDIEIESLKIEGPRYDTTGRVSWTTTANLNIVIRQVKDNLLVVTKDFVATTTTDDSNTSKSAALLQVTDSVARYVDSNRQALNLQSH